MRRWQIRVLITVLSAIAVSSATAQTVYKWVDESGTIQFSDRPPESAVAEEIELELSTESVPQVAESQNGPLEPEPFAMAGRWQNILPDQTIVMTLQPSGGSRWQVTYQGQSWSDLTGTWEADEERLTLHNQLGRTVYGLTVVSEDEIRLFDGQLGTAMLFKR